MTALTIESLDANGNVAGRVPGYRPTHRQQNLNGSGFDNTFEQFGAIFGPGTRNLGVFDGRILQITMRNGNRWGLTFDGVDTLTGRLLVANPRRGLAPVVNDLTFIKRRAMP